MELQLQFMDNDNKKSQAFCMITLSKNIFQAKIKDNFKLPKTS